MKRENKVGRPTKYLERYCDDVVKHMEQGASLTSFAASIDVCRDTITEWANTHPEFSLSVKRGKAKCASWWESVARTGAVGGESNPALIIFGLKNMSPHDWRDKQEVDHQSSDGSMTPTIQVKFID